MVLEKTIKPYNKYKKGLNKEWNDREKQRIIKQKKSTKTKWKPIQKAWEEQLKREKKTFGKTLREEEKEHYENWERKTTT